jgi:hypothetical protein
MRSITREAQVTTLLEEEFKEIKGSAREMLFIQNLSGFDIYVNFGTHADANNGLIIATLTTFNPAHSPSGTVYIKGSQVAAQRVRVVEVYK